MKKKHDLRSALRKLRPHAWVTDDELLREPDPDDSTSDFPDLEQWSKVPEAPPEEVDAAWHQLRARLDRAAPQQVVDARRDRSAAWLPLAAVLVVGVALGVVGDRLLSDPTAKPAFEINTEVIDLLGGRRSVQEARGGSLVTLIVYASRHDQCERYGVAIVDSAGTTVLSAWDLVPDPTDWTLTLTVSRELLEEPGLTLRLLGSDGSRTQVLQDQPLPTLVSGSRSPE